MEKTKAVIDAVSVTTVIATLAQFLPAIAALFSIIWSVIRIWETKTVQCIVTRVRGSRCATLPNERDV